MRFAVALLPFVFTPDQVLSRGLELAGYKRHEIDRVKRATNIDRFNIQYGSSHVVCAQIWEDLLANDLETALVVKKKATIDRFLQAHYLLRNYPTEKLNDPRATDCIPLARGWNWFFVERIQGLKKIKVRRFVLLLYSFALNKKH
jgi:hypothetical protein